MLNLKRVQRELAECGSEADALGITIKPKDDSLAYLIGTIPGPIDTPYEGGVFAIDIVLHGEYPFRPPKMKFRTKVWHPNINSKNGVICLDTLNKEWSPALTIRTALLSVQALLSSPQPDNPQDSDVATQYIEDYQTFVTTARNWTAIFASKPSNLRLVDKVKKLTEMGFPKDSVEKALESVGEDEILALEKLTFG